MNYKKSYNDDTLDQILKKSFKLKNPILLKLLALMALLRLVLLKHEKKTQNIVEKYFKKFVGKFSGNTNTIAYRKKY